MRKIRIFCTMKNSSGFAVMKEEMDRPGSTTWEFDKVATGLILIEVKIQFMASKDPPMKQMDTREESLHDPKRSIRSTVRETIQTETECQIVHPRWMLDNKGQHQK